MILIICMPCALAIRVLPQVGRMDEIEELVGRKSTFWPDQFPCPRCEKMAKGILESTADPRALQLLEVRDLTAFEAFGAVSGLGFPDEQDCTLDVLHELLREQPIRKLHGANVRGCTRSVIEAIELWDGTKIYLGASPDGAVAYRATRPPSTTGRVLREQGVVDG